METKLIKIDDELSYDYEKIIVRDDDHTIRCIRHSIELNWKWENEKLDNQMRDDFDRFKKNRKDFRWIEKIKEISKWKIGQKVYIETKQYIDGAMNIWFEKKPIMKEKLYCLMIDEDGFLQMNFWNEPFNGTSDWTDVDCEYNDINVEK